MFVSHRLSPSPFHLRGLAAYEEYRSATFKGDIGDAHIKAHDSCAALLDDLT